MRIQHNIAALSSHRNLTNNNSAVAKNLEKLSSGYRINRAGDDAAGLAISEKMRAQITGLETAQKNAQDGVSLIQTAEGALTEVHSMLNRMVELADQSANGTYQDTDRDNLQKEVSALKEEIDRISKGTNFNGINLLDGSLGKTTGAPATMVTAGAEIVASKLIATKVSGASINAADGKEDTVTIKQDATDKNKISVEIKAEDGSSKTTVLDLNDVIKFTNGSNQGKSLTEAKAAGLAKGDTVEIDLSSVGLGKIYATASDATTSNDIAEALETKIAGIGTPASGAGDGSGLTLQIGDTSAEFNQLTVDVAKMDAASLGIGTVNVSTQDGAKSAVDSIKEAINKVSSTRGDLGALQNRLEHTINNLGVTTENMTAAEARIRDVDMAKEMMTYTKNNILVQASQAMLAQANQLPQGVLQLLQ